MHTVHIIIIVKLHTLHKSSRIPTSKNNLNAFNDTLLLYIPNKKKGFKAQLYGKMSLSRSVEGIQG